MDALNDPLDEIDASQRAQEEAISVLLRTFVPGEKGGNVPGGCKRGYRRYCEAGYYILSLVGDYERFLRPLGMSAVESRTAEQRGTVYPAFDAWIGFVPIDR